MEYEYMLPPIKNYKFAKFTKEEAEIYFNWYMEEKGHRIEMLEEYVHNAGVDIDFDYSPESLIPLWRWYETIIVSEKKTEEEIENEKKKLPEWLHSQISDEKISMNTLKFGMDIAIYFAEVMIRNSEGKLHWGYVTKPRNYAHVNKPLVLGFKADLDLNPSRLVYILTLRSKRERNEKRLYDKYYDLQEDIE